MYSKKRTNIHLDENEISLDNSVDECQASVYSKNSNNNNNNIKNQKFKKHKSNNDLVHQHLPTSLVKKKHTTKSHTKLHFKFEKGKITGVQTDLPYYEEEDTKNYNDDLVEDSFDNGMDDSSSNSDSDSSSVGTSSLLDYNNIQIQPQQQQQLTPPLQPLEQDNNIIIIHPESPMFPWVSIIHENHIELTSRLIFNDVTCEISLLDNDLYIEYLVQYPKSFCDIVSFIQPTQKFKMIIKHPGPNYEQDMEFKFENSNLIVKLNKIKDYEYEEELEE
ncbi:putative protein serine/threonine kinase [Tieghemostelium lacteum]|uniref:Uncharacterized protein n=1 Tax=Tieghemostelium lacteum TaxID=361077 RepID=A0A152A8U2_TIELA|nr:putative protein serine/threonine kinase [Tieghemostelium lacteum]|eukprot:KYR02640.1 putative protein serine/threonine kinase [Tieghemostelium lacteum]